ncbi:MAG: hypothetical protein NVS4B8_01020 [Herpetosiphon sp.]
MPVNMPLNHSSNKDAPCYGEQAGNKLHIIALQQQNHPQQTTADTDGKKQWPFQFSQDLSDGRTNGGWYVGLIGRRLSGGQFWLR